MNELRILADMVAESFSANDLNRAIISARQFYRHRDEHQKVLRDRIRLNKSYIDALTRNTPRTLVTTVHTEVGIKQSDTFILESEVAELSKLSKRVDALVAETRSYMQGVHRALEVVDISLLKN